MRAYHRLTEGERNQVYALKKAGLTQCVRTAVQKFTTEVAG
jgi:hypothetical protein